MRISDDYMAADGPVAYFIRISNLYTRSQTTDWGIHPKRAKESTRAWQKLLEKTGVVWCGGGRGGGEAHKHKRRSTVVHIHTPASRKPNLVSGMRQVVSFETLSVVIRTMCITAFVSSV